MTKEVYLDVMNTVVKPWMTQVAAGKLVLFQPDGTSARASSLVQTSCNENLDMLWSKELRALKYYL